MIHIEKDADGRTVYLFGKKVLRIRRSSASHMRRELSALQTIVRASVRASSLPPAEGLLRDIQMAELRILREIDRVGREAGLTWWIDFGTLLGAVRHGGFIPWDDDIDICMVREDYAGFVETFNRLKQDDDLEAVLYSHKEGRCNIIKIEHRRLAGLFIDVFPVDVCDKAMDDSEKLTFSRELQMMIGLNSKPINDPSEMQAARAHCLALRDKYLPPVCAYDDENAKTVFYGCEYCHDTHRYNAFDYSDIFPLGSIEFEGEVFPSVAQPDRYLTYVFGDYMALPKYTHVHTDLKKYTPKEIFVIRAYGRGE